MKKVLFLCVIIVMALFVSCADRSDYKEALEKKGYEVIYKGVYDIIIQKENKIGIVEVDSRLFSNYVNGENFVEFIHWLPVTVTE